LYCAIIACNNGGIAYNTLIHSTCRVKSVNLYRNIVTLRFVEGTTGRRREKGRGSSADQVRLFSSSTSRPAAVQFGVTASTTSSQVNTKSESKITTNRRKYLLRDSPFLCFHYIVQSGVLL